MQILDWGTRIKLSSVCNTEESLNVEIELPIL